MSKILLVEDDPEIAELLKLNIDDLAEDTELSILSNGSDGLTAALTGEYDLLLLDIMLPGLHGTEICKRVREVDTETPIILLTARNSELDKVLGLELGADDYVTKPFAVEELFARIRALLRRAKQNKTSLSSITVEQLVYQELSIQRKKREVCIEGTRLDLTPIEYDLLIFFATQPGKTFSRDELLVEIWGAIEVGNESVVNSHVNRLRKKLCISDEQRFIKTLWGVGYRFTKAEELS